MPSIKDPKETAKEQAAAQEWAEGQDPAALLMEMETIKTGLEAQKLAVQVEREELALAEDKFRVLRNEVDEYRLGRFIMIGPVNERSVESILREMRNYAGRVPGGEIHLTFSSPGGEVFSGWHFFDALRQLSAEGHRIVTEASGMAASMAGILFEAGDYRIMGRESYLMIHEPSTGVLGKAFEIKDEAALLERLTRQMCDIYAKRSTLSAEEIYQRISRRDLWLNAEEALELGFIDEIVG